MARPRCVDPTPQTHTAAMTCFDTDSIRQKGKPRRWANTASSAHTQQAFNPINGEALVSHPRVAREPWEIAWEVWRPAHGTARVSTSATILPTNVAVPPLEGLPGARHGRSPSTCRKPLPMTPTKCRAHRWPADGRAQAGDHAVGGWCVVVTGLEVGHGDKPEGLISARGAIKT
jgi:hypothetical protein